MQPQFEGLIACTKYREFGGLRNENCLKLDRFAPSHQDLAISCQKCINPIFKRKKVRKYVNLVALLLITPSFSTVQKTIFEKGQHFKEMFGFYYHANVFDYIDLESSLIVRPSRRTIEKKVAYLRNSQLYCPFCSHKCTNWGRTACGLPDSHTELLVPIIYASNHHPIYGQRLAQIFLYFGACILFAQQSA